MSDDALERDGDGPGNIGCGINLLINHGDTPLVSYLGRREASGEYRKETGCVAAGVEVPRGLASLQPVMPGGPEDGGTIRQLLGQMKAIHECR